MDLEGIIRLMEIDAVDVDEIALEDIREREGERPGYNPERLYPRYNPEHIQGGVGGREAELLK